MLYHFTIQTDEIGIFLNRIHLCVAEAIDTIVHHYPKTIYLHTELPFNLISLSLEFSENICGILSHTTIKFVFLIYIY